MSETFAQPHPAREPLAILTFEGTARSGKGTTVRAVHGSFVERGEAVLVIDQGQKFRSLAYLAIAQGVDLENPHKVDEFLRADCTPNQMREILYRVNKMNDQDRDEMLYTNHMSRQSAYIGRSDHSHGLAVDLMHAQIEDAFMDGSDIVLIDGRTIERHARATSERIGNTVFSAHFACDSLIAARRVEKLFGEISDMEIEDQVRLLETAGNISSRNASDMARAVDPLRRPSKALNFTYEKYEAGDAARVISKSLEVDPSHLRLMIDTTRTKSIDHMTGPLVEIATDAVDEWRKLV